MVEQVERDYVLDSKKSSNCQLTLSNLKKLNANKKKEEIIICQLSSGKKQASKQAQPHLQTLHILQYNTQKFYSIQDFYFFKTLRTDKDQICVPNPLRQYNKIIHRKKIAQLLNLKHDGHLKKKNITARQVLLYNRPHKVK